jgi:hypothetical protein
MSLRVRMDPRREFRHGLILADFEHSLADLCAE